MQDDLHHPGLWLPNHLVNVSSDGAPAEPPAVNNAGVVLDGEALFGTEGTPETLIEVVSGLRAADVIQTASKIMMSLESVDARGVEAAQDRLVAVFPPEAQEEIRALLEAAPGGRGVMFYPQQLLALEWLAYDFGEPGPPTSFDCGAKWLDFIRACAWIGDVATRLSGFDGSGDSDTTTVAIWSLRNAEANRLAFYRGTAGRAYQMWLSSGADWPEGLGTLDDFCSDSFGITYRELVALLLGTAFARSNLAEPQPSDAVFVPGDYLATTRFTDETINRVFEAITFAPTEVGVDEQERYWCFTGFADRPYLSAPSPNLAVSSVRFAFERATTGAFWMLHQASAGSVGDFTTHFGAVFQDYCLRLALSVEEPSRTVSDEVSYTNTNGDRVDTSDVLITEIAGRGAATVMVECGALRPRRDLLAEGSREAFQLWFDRLLGKLGQLDRVIRDYITGAFTIDGSLASVNDSVIPLLVVDHPFQWTFALRALVDEAVNDRKWFTFPQALPPVVCSLSEWESLLHAAESGESIAEVLRGLVASGQDMALEQYLHDRRGELEVPALVNEGFAAMTDLILEELRLPTE